MAQYDGAIRINTNIATKQAGKELKSLEGSIAKTADKVSSLRSKMDSLKDVKVPTQEYKEIQTQIESTKKKIDDLIARQEKFLATGGKETSSTYKRMQYDLEELRNSLPYLKGELQELINSGKAFTLGSDTDEYAQMSAQMQQLNQKMQSDTQRQSELQSALAAEEQRLANIKSNSTVSDKEIISLLERRKQLTQEIADMEKAGVSLGYKEYNAASQELSEIDGKIKEYQKSISNVPEKFAKMNESAKKAFKSVGDGAKSSGGLLSTFASRLKGIALSLLIFNWISKGFNAMVSGMKTGFDNFAKYSSSYAQSVQNMKNAMATLGNQFAAAFAPIVQAVIPWLTSLINMLTMAASAIAQFIAALSGNSTFKAAKKVQDGYNKSLGGTAAAAKKAQKALANFDTLNILNTDDGGGGGGGGGGAGGGMGDMFEEVPIDSYFSEIAQKAKEIFSQLFAPVKAAWEKDGSFVMESWKTALQEIWTLIGSIGRDFLTMWGDEKTVSVLSDILRIFGDIGLIVGNLAGGLSEAWNKNQIGLQILSNIRDIFAIIVSHIRSAADATVKWSESLDFYPLLESINELLIALQPLTETIGAGLEWFYTNVLLPIAAWTIEDVIPEFLNMLAAALTALNQIFVALQPLGIWFWENFLQPLGQWAGETIISAMQTITDLLTKFGNWVSEHQGTVQNMTIIIGAFFAAFKIVTAVIGIVDFIAKMGGLIGIVSKMAGLITTVFNPWTLAIAAVIAVGVLLWKNWDTIKEKAGELKDWLLEKWNAIKEKTSEIWDGIKKKISTTWDNIKTSILEAVENIKTFISETWEYLKINASEKWGEIKNTIVTTFMEVIGYIADAISGIIDIFRGVITFLTGVFTGDWEKAWEGIGLIFEGFSEVLSSIWEIIKALFEGIISFLSEVFTAGWTLVWDTVTGIFSGASKTISDIKQGIEKIFSGLINTLSGVFTRDWKKAWKGVTEIFDGVKKTIKGIVNGILGFIESMANGVVGGINKVIDALNAIKVDIPDWIPGIGGKSFGFNLSRLSSVSIPRLATGAVIRGGDPFMAILGDQPAGKTNIETPLDTMVQAFKQALAEGGYNSGVGEATVIMQLDKKEFGRAVVKFGNKETQRIGVSLI